MINTLYPPFRKWSERGTIWIYSDPHFGDEELRGGIKGRPSDEEILKKINKRVGKYDTFICLGDVGDIEFVKKIRGYKVLICGNHDAGVSKYEEVFDEVYGGPLFISNKILLSHEPIESIHWFNIHGHKHLDKNPITDYTMNVCSDVIGYDPINFNKFIKCGIASKVIDIHRDTIHKATVKKLFDSLGF